MFERLKSIEDAPIDLLLLADPSKDMVLEKLNKGVCFVYKLESEVIGCYVLNEITRDSIELVNIAVSEKKQGCGIGKKLLSHAFDYVKKRGYREIVVGTGNSSIGQIAIYQKAGFRMFDIDRCFFERNYREKIYEHGILCRDMVRFLKRL